MNIVLRGIAKSFGAHQVLRDIDLEIPDGKIVALLGPSGCGKTTLLRIIAGLDAADRGSLSFDGENAAKARIGERRVGFVFQHYALFAHMTVFENVAFGLRVRPRKTRPRDAVIARKVEELLELVKLSHVAQRYPTQLSGGQRQRIALARALAVEPRVLLLDEPFGALDASVRKELRTWLRRLQDELKITTIFVTHDQSEALEIADRVAIMNGGNIEQIGTPDEVYRAPASPFVYAFLGDANLLAGEVLAGRVKIGEWELDVPKAGLAKTAHVFVRPHHLDVSREPAAGEGQLRAHVQRISTVGAMVKIDLMTTIGVVVQAELSQERFRELAVATGAEVYLLPRERHIFLQN